VAALAVVAFAHIRTDAQTHNFAEEWSHTGELLARAAIGARLPDQAEEALVRAEQPGMNPQAVAGGHELVSRMRQ